LGSYSVENGRVQFPTIEDYQQTVSSLQEASDVQKASFRSSISIETSAKAFIASANSMDNENLSNTEVEAIAIFFKVNQI